MRILVATSRGQGSREGDFCWAVEGEPVRLAEPCDADAMAREDGILEPGCGCGRSFSGMSSMRSTTTAEVVESPMSREDFLLALRSADELAGYLSEPAEPEEIAELEREADGLLDLAAEYDVGTLLQRDFDLIDVRTW